MRLRRASSKKESVRAEVPGVKGPGRAVKTLELSPELAPPPGYGYAYHHPTKRVIVWKRGR